MVPPIHHLGYVVEDLHRAVGDLVANGMCAITKNGPAPVAAANRGTFYAKMREASVAWDGSEPPRSMTGAPA